MSRPTIFFVNMRSLWYTPFHVNSALLEHSFVTVASVCLCLRHNPPCLPTPRRATLASARQKSSLSKRSANQRENMLVAWPQALYIIVQSNEGILCEVLRAAATYWKISPLRRRHFWRHNRRGEQHGRSWCTHPKENEGGNQAQNSNSDKDTAVPKEKERIYGIDRLNQGDPAVESESDSEWLHAHWREGQAENKNIEIKVLNVNVTYYLTF